MGGEVVEITSESVKFAIRGGAKSASDRVHPSVSQLE